VLHLLVDLPLGGKHALDDFDLLILVRSRHRQPKAGSLPRLQPGDAGLVAEVELPHLRRLRGGHQRGEGEQTGECKGSNHGVVSESWRWTIILQTLADSGSF